MHIKITVIRIQNTSINELHVCNTATLMGSQGQGHTLDNLDMI